VALAGCVHVEIVRVPDEQCLGGRRVDAVNASHRMMIDEVETFLVVATIFSIEIGMGLNDCLITRLAVNESSMKHVSPCPKQLRRIR
jgi:hypothetical protein